MSPSTSNYETTKMSSSKNNSLDSTLPSGNTITTNQGKIQSTILQSIVSSKMFVTLVVVVLFPGVMAYNANTDASAAIVNGTKGVGFTGSKNVGRKLIWMAKGEDWCDTLGWWCPDCIECANGQECCDSVTHGWNHQCRNCISF